MQNRVKIQFNDFNFFYFWPIFLSSKTPYYLSYGEQIMISARQYKMLPKKLKTFCQNSFPGLVVRNFLLNELRIFAWGSLISKLLFCFELRMTETLCTISRSAVDQCNSEHYPIRVQCQQCPSPSQKASKYNGVYCTNIEVLWEIP